MKQWRLGLMAMVLVLFTGCYEVTEEIVINQDGSGTYSAKMDMSALVQMMQAMGGDEMSKNGMDRSIDTVMMLSKVIDSAKDATEEQKRLFKDGKLAIKFNLKENVFNTDMNFPFKSYDDLQKLVSGAGTAGLAQTFKKVFLPDSAQSSVPMDNQDLDQVNGLFDVKVSKNGFSRQLNQERFKALMARPELAQLSQMKDAGMELLYTTIIKLPRPVSKSDNPLLKLSEDKKTVTLRYDLVKLLDAPEKYSYSIEY